MWVIFEKKSLVRSLKRIPQEILDRYEAWKKIVELSGPFGLREFPGFRDERLRGKWKGFRSSRLSIQWRVVYKIEEDHFEVYVIEITPHKY
ncbi:type II toxin-antitoxin system YafQ family toxin [Bdellovibrionota bacterium]